jgi:glycosyltransferase involved in cell wall biosynthesis
MDEKTPDISVIICAYTERRWDELVAAVESVQRQTLPPMEIIVVIDRNPNLLLRVRENLPDVIAIENCKAKGASGSRNSGLAVAQGSILAFLDDDAVAQPDWIENLAACYTSPQVVGVGGKIEPHWSGSRPSWFPAEFNWVIGCTYQGMPTKDTPVRNVIGANMSVRRHVLTTAGGFRESFGNNKDTSTARARSKWLRHHAGDEETEFCIRVTQQLPDSVWLYTTTAVVKHQVPVQRTRWTYFLWRCYDEGLGKAGLVRLHGTQAGLSSERTYTFKVLPQGLVRGFTDALFHRDLAGLARVGAIVTGLTMTTVGYLVGSISSEIAILRNLSMREKSHSSKLPLSGDYPQACQMTDEVPRSGSAESYTLR